MKAYICLISFVIVVASIPNYNRKHLIPKTLAQKLCEQDNSMTICSLPEVTPPRNPVSIWRVCEDQPHLLLCRYKPPARLPMYKIFEVTTEEPHITEVILIENEEPKIYSRRTLMEKDVLEEKRRRQEEAKMENDVNDSIMIGTDRVFEDIRLI